jgi:SAM-dependent methyltransferase
MLSRMEREVAPDGSPVAVYRALPAVPEFTPVLNFLVPPATVLDLGCGVGRLANELALRGFDVTGVDESRVMLNYLHANVRAVESQLQGLNLGRRFDVVVLASHLVNVADDEARRAFLVAAADHAAPTGAVLIQHWEVPPTEPVDIDTEVAGVRIAFRVLGRHNNDFEGSVEYTVADQSWVQNFRATLLDDAQLDAELMRTGLRRSRRLTPKWLVAHRIDRGEGQRGDL